MPTLRTALALVALTACSGVQLLPDGGLPPPPPDSGLPELPDGGRAHCDGVPLTDGFTLHIDPAQGDDLQGTGSGTAGGAPEPACAYRTITRALALARVAARPSMHLQVDSFGFLGSGEAFPLVLPAGTSLAGAPGLMPRLSVFAGTGLQLSASGTSVSGLVLDGAGSGAVGVLASAGTSALQDVEVTGFTTVGVRAEQSAVLTVAGASKVHHNALGVLLVDTASVTLDGTGASEGAPLEVSSNANQGLEVRGAARLTATGVRSPFDPPSGSLVVTGNSRHGILVQQQLLAEGSASPPASSLTGVVVRGNGSSGLRLLGGSALSVRESYLSGNGQHGVHVQTDPAFVAGGAGANTGNFLGWLDLGRAGAPGANDLEDPDHLNGLKGVCLALDSGGSTGGALKLAGNRFAGAGGVVVDCQQLAATLAATGDCDAQGSLGDVGRNPKNDFELGLCVVP